MCLVAVGGGIHVGSLPQCAVFLAEIYLRATFEKANLAICREARLVLRAICRMEILGRFRSADFAQATQPPDEGVYVVCAVECGDTNIFWAAKALL